MGTQLLEDIEALNNLNLVKYLNILGHTPLGGGPDSTDYQIVLLDEVMFITVYHATNRFHDKDHNIHGSLVYFACLYFGITPMELLDNIVAYYIDQLL